MRIIKIKSQMTRLTILLMVFILFVPNANAQFLKKLQKRVEQKVENVVIEKTANKAADKMSNSMDKIFDVNPFGGGSKEKANPSLVPESYDFTWSYSLKMSTKDGEIIFHYFLKPGAPYFAFTTPIMQNILTVMDNEHKITVMFMLGEGNNTGMVTQMMNDQDFEEAKNTAETFTFETLPDKTINGFDCKGVRAFNEGYEMEMYFITDAEVSFDDIYKNSKTKIPDALKDYFNPDDKVLMISMDIKNLKKPKQSATMECIGLEEMQKKVNKSDYKFM